MFNTDVLFWKAKVPVNQTFDGSGGGVTGFQSDYSKHDIYTLVEQTKINVTFSTY